MYTMMSLPDFREKQILFITGSDVSENRISFRNENILLTRDGETVNQLSLYKTFALFVTGQCSLTSVLIRNCRKYGVSLFLLGDNFSSYAEIIALATGNYLLRGKQYAQSADDSFEAARVLVANKIENQYRLLRERDAAIDQTWLDRRLAAVEKAGDNESLLGVEGSATKAYYEVYFSDIGWYRRMPRTKVDINNLLLDIGYTFLFNFTDAILSLFGFDTYKGVYHRLFFQRKSLACDLMEPLRGIIDRQLVKSHHLKQITEADFLKEKEQWLLPYQHQMKYAGIFAQAIMDRKENIFSYIRAYYYYAMNGEGDMPTFAI